MNRRAKLILFLASELLLFALASLFHAGIFVRRLRSFSRCGGGRRHRPVLALSYLGCRLRRQPLLPHS